MKEIKTKPIQASVESYIVKLDIQKQEDAKILIQMFSEVSQEKPVMWGPSIIGFGQRLYKYESGREISYFYAGFSMRKKAISSGNKLCEADARAITMNEVHIRIVTKAAIRPMAFGENFILNALYYAQ